MTEPSAPDPAPSDRAEEFLAWLDATLAGSRRRHGDGSFRWLTSLEDAAHERLAGQARYALRRLPELIPGLDPRPPVGGWPAVVFATRDEQLAYRTLMADLIDDARTRAGVARDEAPAAAEIIDGGSWNPWPVGHLAIPFSDGEPPDAAFAHELVHAVLSDEGVPVWLQEGVATEVETRLGARREPMADLYEWGRTTAYWREHDPAPFWTGAAFTDPASSEHAYRLAQVVGQRWTRSSEALAAARSLGFEGWRDQDAALRGLIGMDRRGVLAPLRGERRMGWVERWIRGLVDGVG